MISSESRHEIRLGLRNAILLTASLVGTLGVAIAVRIWMPRYLGPDAFGRLRFAEELAAAGMFFTTLGVETYIERELATRPAHVSDFFGGLIQARLLATVLVAAGLAGLLLLMGKPLADWPLVFLFAAGQVAFVLNGSLACCLQAVGRVRALAVVNVVAKIAWGAGVVAGLALGVGVAAVPLAFFAAELLRAPVLFAAARKHLGLRLSFSLTPALSVLALSFPYYLNQLAHELYGRLGITMISWLAQPAEVGWFGAATNVTTLALLALPVLNAVMLPMSSRVAVQSRAALDELMRGSVRIIATVTIPLAVLLSLNAPSVVRFLFSSSYAPAANSLQVLSLLVPVTCYCVVAGMHLVQIDRVRRLTAISFVGLAAAAILTPLLITWGGRHLGPGGAGTGAAAAAVTSELLVAVLMRASLGAAARDEALVELASKLFAVSAVVCMLHFGVAGLGLGAAFVEAAVFLGLAAVAGVAPVRAVVARARTLWRRTR